MTAIPIFKIMPQLLLKKQRSISYFVKEIETQCDSVEETPEMLRAIDEGIRSLEQHGSIPIERVRAEFEKKWTTQ